MPKTSYNIPNQHYIEPKRLEMDLIKLYPIVN